MTPGDALLSVAIDTGCSLHAALARAFQLSYGAAPSVWRRVATLFWLEALHGVHFMPAGCVRFAARRPVCDLELLLRMVEHHVWLVGGLVGRAAGLRDYVLEPTDRALGRRHR